MPIFLHNLRKTLLIDIQATTIYTVTPTSWVEYTPEVQYNLQRWSSVITPLTYGANPSPSTIPGGPQCYGITPVEGEICAGAYKRAASPEPTAPAAPPDIPIEARDAPSFCAPSATVTQTVLIDFYTETTVVRNAITLVFRNTADNILTVRLHLL